MLVHQINILSIVVSGKMFEKAFKDKNLAPENLSRTLEDSATVTSALNSMELMWCIPLFCSRSWCW